jgi:hypothetical protein
MLAAFEIRLTRRRQLDLGPGPKSDRVLNASLVAVTVVVLCLDPGLDTLALAFLALFLVQATDHLMVVPAAIGLLACGGVGLAAFSLQLPLFIVTLLLLTTAFAAIEAATIGGRAKRARLRVSSLTRIGLLALSRRELLALVAIAAGIGLLLLLCPDAVGSPLADSCALVAIAAIVGYCNRCSGRVPRLR